MGLSHSVALTMSATPAVLQRVPGHQTLGQLHWGKQAQSHSDSS